MEGKSSNPTQNSIEIPANKTTSENSANPLVDNERLENYSQKLNDILPIRGYPSQDYFQATVFPILLEGLSWLSKERPEDPVESLALFLIKNDPNHPDPKVALNIDQIE
ncbi:Protein dpy-30 like protein [Tritrichomonas foetus]|uniref:Protein dpy-30 like protein n=1 Tax=Tritrichomonas foetus TaxID=1144522 RepID=A0A1J4JGH6_9EUKA|nr:Protein dpy-30 like protein [Tritrichomonas foetus]|eukprot:OHS96747.1 Protein dpy-30 like protein [Tritrichomonas foetus]